MKITATISCMLRRLALEAAWAPIAVLIFHGIMVRTPYQVAFDHVHHTLGGVAISYFFLKAVGIAAPLIGKVSAATAYIFAFSLACMAAVFWEFSEFASDQLLRTRIQISLKETMADLIFGVAGAALTLCAVAVKRKGRHFD